MARRDILVDGLLEEGAVRDLLHPAGHPASARPRSDPYGRTGWLLAIGLMVTLHAFWWFWLSPRKVETVAPPPRGAAIRFLSGDYGRRIWTPTVLALPTEIGFSAAAMTNQFGEGPAIRMPQGPVHFLKRKTYEPEPVSTAHVWTSPPLVVQAPPPPEPAWAGGASAPLPQSSGLVVTFAGNRITDPKAAGLEWPAGLAKGAEAWRIKVWVEFDDQRQVSHALVDESSGDPARDRLVLQALYRWRDEAVPDATSGTITLAYLPVTPAATGAAP